MSKAIIDSLTRRFNRIAISCTALLCCVACSPEPKFQRIDTEPASTDTGPVDTGTQGAETDTDSMTDTDEATVDLGLVINEVMSKNDGAALDDALEADDWIELLNVSGEPIHLSNFLLGDSKNSAALQDLLLAPWETVLLFADNEPSQGALHLPFKLDASGETVSLYDLDHRLGDRVAVPELPANESFARLPDGRGAFAHCRYATPGKTNGDSCTPPPPYEMETISFEPYTWPEEFPPVAKDLILTELSLRPAAFIELENNGSDTVQLEDFTLRVAPHKPGLPWPAIEAGEPVPLPDKTLAPGERIAVPVNDAATAVLETDPLFEGVVTLFHTENGETADRVDFMSWPKDAQLARPPEHDGIFVFCTNATPGAPNTCDRLPSRPIGDRLRYLRTPSDFAALAEGETLSGVDSVKFVMDLEGGGAVHLLSSRAWDLHYTFVREVIDGDPHLDRCVATENAEFHAGWTNFSYENYFTVEGRRYHLGTLSHHGGANLKCVEYTFGDAISPRQMVDAFFAAAAHTDDPTAWVLRPQDDKQVERAREVEGTAPFVGPTAPFAGVTFQPLTVGVGYGYLTFLSVEELTTTRLGADKIVVLSDVPNDLPFVGGVITEAFQTPLSHVNILSRSRNTPNMALMNARADAEIAPLEGALVKLSVFPSHFEIALADPKEAKAHWDALKPEGPLRSVPSDLSVRGVVDLDIFVGYENRSAVGVKAAALSELQRISYQQSYCIDTLPLKTPENAFAIPVAHEAAHFEASGAADLLDQYLDDEDFNADPVYRGEQLEKLRETITSYPVDDALLADLEEAVAERFGDKRVRFRSSSNVEDLADFNGAGLYTSRSAEIGNDEMSVEDAVRTVWASLWEQRAFDEREFAGIDQRTVRMGVLVHEAFRSEEANGVAVSRDILDPNRGDRYYYNAQAGEAAVTNPAPGVSTEEVVYQWPSRTPTLRVSSRSSLIDGPVLIDQPQSNPSLIPVLGEVNGESRNLVCAMYSIHNHFREILDPYDENPWFAMEAEFKLLHGTRLLLIKQARPYSFGNVEIPNDCRTF